MAIDHEYSVIDHPRAVIGRWLGTAAGAIAAIVTMVAPIITGWFDQLHAKVGTPQWVVAPVAAGVVFTLVHLAFDKLVWRWPLVKALLRIPDLNGVWEVTGRTMNPVEGAPSDWRGELRVVQTWEKIWVQLKTEQSCSSSKAASLLRQPGAGCVLMYSYRNEPRIGEAITPHVGYAELTFDEGLTLADGEYFNSKGRTTFGRMTLARRK
ncbi:hypothetical protein SAMN05216382_2646 [Sphingomonas palmae]|uniref:CD-NTase-associated protein 15 domain-containing protein n=1 Tax=Sphingomonas palmae TaxID=1855283 RepID=A0A1H7T2K5_9SPHN|nr:hypothetical protein [Sphingomonas palmae]SEL78958.1 hypothetical protein SAMN05216382_2646 [Sphingomonas palmae]